MGNIYLDFSSLLPSDYRNGAKTVSVRFEMAPKLLVHVVRGGLGLTVTRGWVRVEVVRGKLR